MMRSHIFSNAKLAEYISKPAHRRRLHKPEDGGPGFPLVQHVKHHIAVTFSAWPAPFLNRRCIEFDADSLAISDRPLYRATQEASELRKEEAARSQKTSCGNGLGLRHAGFFCRSVKVFNDRHEMQMEATKTCIKIRHPGKIVPPIVNRTCTSSDQLAATFDALKHPEFG